MSISIFQAGFDRPESWCRSWCRSMSWSRSRSMSGSVDRDEDG